MTNNDSNVCTYKFNTPIIFIIFNRPDNAQKIFNRIKEQKPPVLLVIADGAREKRHDDIEKTIETRKIIEQVDWDCKVYTNFSDINLGCKKRITTGLDWAFSIVDKAIILEDDCLANDSFFRFCQEMLDKYENDTRIMMISGNNNSFNSDIADSYYFSRYFHIWGWATWARAWKHNDGEIKAWQQVKKEKLFYQFFDKKSERYYWTHYFDLMYEKKIDTWDVTWICSAWMQSGLSIAPKFNLVTNIGFGGEATHTSGKSIFANMKTQELDFPLKHPKYVIANYQLDKIEIKIRNKDSKRLPYPLQMIAGKIKWFLKRNKK